MTPPNLREYWDAFKAGFWDGLSFGFLRRLGRKALQWAKERA